MCDGYNVAGEHDLPGLEDEFLCEYVDGTMDPVVREVFEEYVQENPDLQEHIDCLRHTRLLLCRYGCRCHAPRDLHDRLRREITCDLVHGRVPFYIIVADRLKGVAGVSTAMAILLVIGILGGVSVVDSNTGPPSTVSAAVVSDQRVRTLFPSLETRQADQISMLRAPRQSPRVAAGVPLHAERSLVATGLEKELRSRSGTAYAAALDRSPAFP